jgi:agmatinase
MLNESKLTNPFIGCESEYKTADIVLLGAPFDGTTSYRPGARFGGKVIRAESEALETYSPYLNKDLQEIKVFDSGELELPFGNTKHVLDIIYNAHKQLHADGKLPVMLGGEHLITLPAVRAAVEKYPDLNIVHFDAHTDLRDEYMGEKLSHACVIRRCRELVGDGRIYTQGIRSGTREEFEWAKKKCIIPDDIPKCGNAYLTIDLDVLDPAEFPYTPAPTANGLSAQTFLNILQLLKENYRIVGIGLFEYAPAKAKVGLLTSIIDMGLRLNFEADDTPNIP